MTHSDALLAGFRLVSSMALSAIATLGACAGVPIAHPPRVLELRALGGHQTIAIVKVRRPWYAISPLILRGFRKALPTYRAVPGLERKWFTISDDGYFGGVYKFADRDAAERWFGPQWHARVLKTYGWDGDVRLMEVSRALDAPGQEVAEGELFVCLGLGPLADYQPAMGLVAAYGGDGGDDRVVSVWGSREQARGFFGTNASVECFDAPVSVDNRPGAR